MVEGCGGGAAVPAGLLLACPRRHQIFRRPGTCPGAVVLGLVPSPRTRQPHLRNPQRPWLSTRCPSVRFCCGWTVSALAKNSAESQSQSADSRYTQNYSRQKRGLLKKGDLISRLISFARNFRPSMLICGKPKSEHGGLSSKLPA